MQSVDDYCLLHISAPLSIITHFTSFIKQPIKLGLPVNCRNGKRVQRPFTATGISRNVLILNTFDCGNCRKVFTGNSKGSKHLTLLINNNKIRCTYRSYPTHGTWLEHQTQTTDTFAEPKMYLAVSSNRVNCSQPVIAPAANSNRMGRPPS